MVSFKSVYFETRPLNSKMLFFPHWHHSLFLKIGHWHQIPSFHPRFFFSNDAPMSLQHPFRSSLPLRLLPEFGFLGNGPSALLPHMANNISGGGGGVAAAFRKHHKLKPHALVRYHQH